MLGVSADDKHWMDCVTIDGKVVVGRRLHHRAGVHRRRPQGQSSPLPLSGLKVAAKWAAAWPLDLAARWCRVRAPSSGRRRRSGPSDFLAQTVTQMSHIFTQRACIVRYNATHLMVSTLKNALQLTPNEHYTSLYVPWTFQYVYIPTDTYQIYVQPDACVSVGN